MPRWLHKTLVLILFSPVALMTGLMLCEALPSTKGWMAAAINEKHLWIAGTVFCLTCLALLYEDWPAKA